MRYLLLLLIVGTTLFAARRQTRNGAAVDFKEITYESKKSFEKGWDFLMQAQNKDGGFGIDINRKSDIACTSLVGLILLTQGNFPLLGENKEVHMKILNFLLNKTDKMPNIDITHATATQVQNKIGRHAHSFFAGIYLSQVYGNLSDGKLNQRVGLALKKLIKVVSNSQSGNGSWGGGSWAPVLGTVLGWECLHASKSSGFFVPNTSRKAEEFVIGKMGKVRGNWMHDLYKNVAGIRIAYSLGNENEPKVKKAWQNVLNLVSKDDATAFRQAGGEEFLAFHLITECMIQYGGDSWKKWYPNVRDKLINIQNKDGSWQGRHCITSRVFCTACSLLILKAPNRYLPISDD